MSSLLQQQHQSHTAPEASQGRAPMPGMGGGNASLLQAIQMAQAGDMTLFEAMRPGDGVLMQMMQEATATQETGVMGGVSQQGAAWVDVGTRAQETQAEATMVGGPAQANPESVAADNSLPDAVEIHDSGPVQSWSGIGNDMNTSQPVEDGARVAQLLEPELGVLFNGNYQIHIDREAWRVAETYNCDAAIVNSHVYIHRRVEESISEELFGPVVGPQANMPQRPGGLIQTQWRPPFAQISGSDIVMTDGNYTIEMSAPTIIIYDETGKEITKIWGDPHVNEGGAKDAQWHFGEDSTFILPDGTKICCDTEPNAAGEWYVVGVDVIGGNQRFHHGKGGDKGMTRDGAEWDLAHADRSEDASAGIFALQDNAQWAVQAKDGNFYDIDNESWKAYQNDRDIDFNTANKAKGITDAQRAVAGDADLKNQQRGAPQQNAGLVSASSHSHEEEFHAWVAMQEVEVNRQTGQVVDPLRYMPQALRILERGEPNFIPGIDREMNVSKVAENEALASNLIDKELNVTMGWYNVHMDEEAWKVAHAYNSELVLWGQEMFVHHDVYQRIEADYNRPAQQPATAPQDKRAGFLMEPKWRAPFLKHSDSAVVITPAGYTIEMKDHEVIIFDDKGAVETRIWGDPHVNERGGGDNWHFGNDSTFILPDGTKLCLDTKETSPGVFVTVGVDVLNGSERYHYGVGDDAGMKRDAEVWDLAHADAAADAHAGVFALQDNGEWAIMAQDGKFYDITDETWDDYLKDKDVDFDPNKMARGLTDEQLAVAGDRDLQMREEARKNGWGTARAGVSNGRRYQRFERLHVEAEVMALLIRDDVVQRRQ